MESFYHSLKTELVYLRHFRTRAEAKRALFEFIEVFYNRQRLHSSLGYQPPEEFETLRVTSWFRVHDIGGRSSVLPLNVMNIFRRQVLPARWSRSRPQTLRFKVFAVAGRLVRHAGQWVAKIRGHNPRGNLLEQAQWSLERFCRLQP
ncbi:MAG: IS3 family transposase [Synergistaceae bacterium]|jgi:hypothetical protein|nr:IS3 family transposase [Synergistaceae bacterium]